jgi:hypothetical protein
MRPITDGELVLFHYRDGLDAARQAQIADALALDAALSARYALLQATLDASELDPAPEPSAAFSRRLQQHIATVTGAPATSPAVPPSPRPGMGGRGFGRRRLLRRSAAAAAAALLLAVGFYGGRLSTPPPATDPVAAMPALDAQRIYGAMLARHLGSTRQALLTAVNSEPEAFGAGNARLAEALIDSNRLYLAAAEASGDRRLAELLRALEPVLIELANPADADDIQVRKGVSDYVERSDLLFQVRAAEAGLRARTTTRT